MMPLLHSILWSLAPGHPHDAAVSSGMLALGVLLGFLLLVAVLMILRIRSIAAELRDQTAAFAAHKQEHKRLNDKTKKLRKDFDSKRDAVVELKKDLASQRKKTHAAQQESKKLRIDIQEQRSTLEKKSSTKPAFEPEKKKDEPKATQPKPQAEPVKGISVTELQDKVATLAAANDALRAELQSQGQKLEDDVQELAQMRKRVEDYRRIDIITKSQLEVLEDRISHLGAQYYDAVSEVAVLKGEVAPMRPTSAKPRTVDVRDDEAETQTELTG